MNPTPVSSGNPWTGVVDVSAVIIHVRGFAQLANCLSTLYESLRGVSVEALVVDNVSDTAGLEELVAGYPNAKLVRLKQRLGYAASTNCGIAASTGRHILWCNDDLLFHPGAVDRMASFLDLNPDYGAAGPKLLNPDGTFQPSFSLVHISLPSLIAERLNLQGVLPSKWSPWRSALGRGDADRDIAVGGGACMLIRRTALDAIGGGVDERFFMYAEEFDLSYRLQKAGWKIRYLSSAMVVHLGNQTAGASPAGGQTAHHRWIIQSWRSRFAYLRKHSGPAAEAAYAAVFAATALLRAAILRARALVALGRRDDEATIALRGRARLHAYAARMAMTARRADADQPPDYPPAPAREGP